VLVRPDDNGGRRTGNALLMDLLADEVRVVSELGLLSADRLLEIDGRRPIFESVADELRAVDERPFVLLGSSVPLGAIAYVRAFLEIMDTAGREGVTPDVLCVTSMGATHAGLALAARLLGSSCRVVGFAYAPTDGAGPGWVARLANGAASILEQPNTIQPLDIENDDSMSGPRYGVDSPESVAAMGLLAETEGVLLDPVYTAKGMAGMLDQIRRGAISHTETVLFVHTGGLPAIFAHRGDATPMAGRVDIDA
jgi:1-aminocyclopropane-1-carboxylate deaminase/D-cysteine desulfhydrase-like pyridoxal-dependent ACC family enzyme